MLYNMDTYSECNPFGIAGFIAGVAGALTVTVPMIIQSKNRFDIEMSKHDFQW